jgi:hypothetical protein
MNTAARSSLRLARSHSDAPIYDIDALHRELQTLAGVDDAGDALKQLVDAGLDALPPPGSGRTLLRWQMLAAVAAHDLSLVKLYEGHTDALAILSELNMPPPQAQTRWAMWAAEPPQARVYLQRNGDGANVMLTGRKAWCSGAASVTHALLTAWEAQPGADDRGPFLVAVDLHQWGVHVTDEGWQAIGMAGSASVDVTFDEAPAQLIGEVGDYLQRPGFWQGGVGIAACWYGGAAALADALKARVAARSDAHSAAHLGAVDVALQETAALLRQAAAQIDRNPRANAQALAMQTRASAERSAALVLDHVGRALGAAPFCRDAEFARRAADLPVFLRQSHAERDLQALGELRATEAGEWAL